MSTDAPDGHVPSGHQYELSHGLQRLTVVEVGGGIREYAVGARDVLNPYPLDQMCDGAHGTPLVPWPNRLAYGRYEFDGVAYQVALTEPEKSNAIHGFLRWHSWTPRSESAAELVMGSVLHPLPGYPFTLDIEVGYRLDDGGLTVTTTATNLGRTTAPWACGAHPYLSPGYGLVDDCELQFGAGVRIDTDDRQLPVGDVATAGTDFDFSSARRIGDLAMDFAFRDLVRDSEGRAWVALTGQDGRTAKLWLDTSYPLVEVYTADTLAPNRRRRGLGVEPMTAPPNAFASGDGVIRLEPGQSSEHRWGVVLG